MGEWYRASGPTKPLPFQFVLLLWAAGCALGILLANLLIRGGF